MAPITTVRVATCVLAVTLVGTAAATLPAEARADDGPASVSDSTAVVPPVDSGAALAEEASAVIEVVVADALGEDGQAEGGSSSVEGTPVATPATDMAAETPSTTTPASEPEPPMPDTMPIHADTAGDTAVTTSQPTQASSIAVQSAPSNVNVSVRIGSAGDNGPVTQVNVAASTASSAPTGTTPPAAATSGAASSTGGTPVSPAVSQPAAAAPASAQDDDGTWSWQWNCLSMPDLSAISPDGSGNTSVPRNWTWIWNCGSNPAQYQDATSAQYQPSNVNVAIRISSPGNDGPVSQANVAVAVSAGAVAVAVHPPQAPVISLPVPSSSSDAVLPGIASPSTIVAPADPTWLGGDTSVQELVGSIFEVVDLQHALPPFIAVGATGTGISGAWLLLALRAPGLTELSPPVGPLELGTRAPGGSLAAAVGAAANSSSASEGSSARPARETPAPRWRAPHPQPIQESVPSGASIAPATSGGSSGGGIPIFLALPFLAAMLDLARRVTLDRVALPTGHRSRMPENPG